MEQKAEFHHSDILPEVWLAASSSNTKPFWMPRDHLRGFLTKLQVQDSDSAQCHVKDGHAVGQRPFSEDTY